MFEELQNEAKARNKDASKLTDDDMEDSVENIKKKIPKDLIRMK